MSSYIQELQVLYSYLWIYIHHWSKVLWKTHKTTSSAGLVAQLAEHCTDIAELRVLVPVQVWILQAFLATTQEAVKEMPGSYPYVSKPQFAIWIPCIIIIQVQKNNTKNKIKTSQNKQTKNKLWSFLLLTLFHIKLRFTGLERLFLITFC